MSGHNKWSKIKHKKAATDAKKSKEYAKLANLIATESKKAEGDTSSPGLRGAIDKARSLNMPGDNISRAVAKGVASKDSAENEVTYEVYGPGGVAMLIIGMTDNNNRTAAEIKHLLSKHQLELAAPGSALWAFEQNSSGKWRSKSTIALTPNERDKLEALIDTISSHDDILEVCTNTE